MYERLKKFKEKSTRKAPLGLPNLETFIELCDLEISQTKVKSLKKHNLTKGEREALKNLSKDWEIIIQKADKGGVIVIQNTRDYITQCHKDLDNDKFYMKISKDPTKEFRVKINNVVDEMCNKNQITKTISQLLRNDSKCKTPQIYFLPKIHKGKIPHQGDQ